VIIPITTFYAPREIIGTLRQRIEHEITIALDCRGWRRAKQLIEFAIRRMLTKALYEGSGGCERGIIRDSINEMSFDWLVRL